MARCGTTSTTGTDLSSSRSASASQAPYTTLKKEAYGDDHIHLTLDAQYADLVNDKNKSAQVNCLVLESICQNPLAQAVEVDTCKDFHFAVEVPKKGDPV
jgi:hypothetical protein